MKKSVRVASIGRAASETQQHPTALDVIQITFAGDELAPALLHQAVLCSDAKLKGK